MGKIICLFTILQIMGQSYAQNNEWLNLTFGNEAFAIADAGNILWIGTNGGLVKLDKQNDILTFYNRANANLPDNHIRTLAIDSSGYLWIGTQYSGVGRFDGKRCQVFNTANSGLPSDQWNTEIEVDPAGNLWIGSLMYISKYDGRAWKNKETGNPYSAYFAINDILFDKTDTAWIAASWGLGRLTGDTLIEGFAGLNNEIYSLAIDKNNVLWIGTNGNGLIKYDGINKTVFDTSNSAIPCNTIYDMKFDSKGNLWLATYEGLVKYDGSNWMIYNENNSGLPEDVIYKITIDLQNVIWIGTRDKGLIKYDGMNWEKYNLSNSIFPSNYISSIALDGKGYVWFGTSSLIKYDRNSWTLYDTSNSGLVGTFYGNIAVKAIESDEKENLWIGYRGEPWLTKYDGQNWFHYDSTNSPFSKELVSCLRVDPDDNLWIGSSRGLVKFDGKNWAIYNMENTPLTSNVIYDIEFDKEGNLWCGLGFNVYYDNNGNPAINIGGLAKFDGNNWYIYNTGNSGLPFDNVGRIAFDSEGVLWLATWHPGVAGIEYGGGLTKFDGINWTTYNIDNSPLTSNTIFDIAVDKDDNLWLSTCAGGLVKYDRKNSWAVYNILNSGIAFNSQNVVAIDSYGNKWIGHNESGVSVFREGGVIITEIKKNNFSKIVNSFSLDQNYPNPFNPTTTIKYQIPNDGLVTLKIYDELGREVKTLVNQYESKGKYDVNFNASNLSSGIYFYQLRSLSSSGKNYVSTKKMLLLK